MAVTADLSPDGTTLLALTSGFNQNLDSNGNVAPATSNEYVFVYDVSHKQAKQTQVLQIKTNAFDGLGWNPSGKEFYVSGGPDDLVHVFNVMRGSWKEALTIPLNHNGIGLGIGYILPVAAGLSVTADGKHLLVANYENDSVSAIDLAAHAVVSELDLRPGIIDPSQAGKPGGSYPCWVAIKGNDRAYVSSQRDREIVVIDLSALPALKVIDRIPLPGQPNKMILDRSGDRLLVAHDNTDTVAVISNSDDKVVAQIDTIAPRRTLPNPHQFKGAGPNSLVLSPDENWLYVTNGGTNSVAVIRLQESDNNNAKNSWREQTPRTVGLVPTWYPNAVAASSDGSMLYVLNGKSIPGPNPRACIDTAEVTSDFNDYSCESANQYMYQIMHASIASIPLPAQQELDRLTKQVAANDGFAFRGEEDDASLPNTTRRDREMMEFLHQHVQHVLFIVKENTTYDQVLGDLEKGNGDPSLVSLPEVLTPNHHSVARKFVTLDNTYCTG